jgi:hypothetical protein
MPTISRLDLTDDDMVKLIAGLYCLAEHVQSTAASEPEFVIVTDIIDLAERLEVQLNATAPDMIEHSVPNPHRANAEAGTRQQRRRLSRTRR